MKEHLLRKFLDSLIDTYPEFCVKFVVEYAPQQLEHLREITQSCSAGIKKSVPKSINEQYLWKGKWSAADMEVRASIHYRLSDICV